ncbi:MAG: hypothetical protein AAF202_07120, partial [Pseudomonadota bacterium]
MLCTTALVSAEPLTVHKIVHGSQFNETYYIQQPALSPTRVSLDDNFVHFDAFSDLLPAIGSQLRMDHPADMIDLLIQARDGAGYLAQELRTAYSEWDATSASKHNWLESLRAQLLVSTPQDVPENLMLALDKQKPATVAWYANLEWQARRQHVLFGLNTTVWRGPLDADLSTSIPSEELAVFRSLVLSPSLVALRSLYESYEDQGPERSELLPHVFHQDKTEYQRYVRFLISRYVKPMGYLQILTSRGEDEPLHIEQAWGSQVASFVERKPGELIAEMG